MTIIDKTAIRKEKQDDEDSITKLNDMVFNSTEESAIVSRLRESGDLFLSLVAEIDSEIVGHVAFSRVTLDSCEGDEVFMGLAPMSVAPGHQRKGIGSALVNQGIEILKEQSVAAVFVLGHKDYYPKFGFKPTQSTYGIKSTYDVPDEVFMALELKIDVLNDVEGIARYCGAFGG